jgi:hypothetical protein
MEHRTKYLTFADPRHAWSNPFDEQCHVLGVMIGAQHDLVEPPAPA